MARVYQMTCAKIASKARIMVNDTGTAAYRAPDSEVIGWINDALNTLVNIFPGLFSKNSAFVCDAGYLQSLTFARAVRLSEVIGIPEADRDTLTQFYPNWPNETQGAIVNWMRMQGEPLRFDVYPPAVNGAVLTVRYVESPIPLTALTDLIPMPENFEPALVEYVTGRIETKDDEYVNSGRAAQMMDRFVAQASALGGK